MPASQRPPAPPPPPAPGLRAVAPAGQAAPDAERGAALCGGSPAPCRGLPASSTTPALPGPRAWPLPGALGSPGPWPSAHSLRRAGLRGAGAAGRRAPGLRAGWRAGGRAGGPASRSEPRSRNQSRSPRPPQLPALTERGRGRERGRTREKGQGEGHPVPGRRDPHLQRPKSVPGAMATTLRCPPPRTSGLLPAPPAPHRSPAPSGQGLRAHGPGIPRWEWEAGGAVGCCAPLPRRGWGLQGGGEAGTADPAGPAPPPHPRLPPEGPVLGGPGPSRGASEGGGGAEGCPPVLPAAPRRKWAPRAGGPAV